MLHVRLHTLFADPVPEGTRWTAHGDPLPPAESVDSVVGTVSRIDYRRADEDPVWRHFRIPDGFTLRRYTHRIGLTLEPAGRDAVLEGYDPLPPPYGLTFNDVRHVAERLQLGLDSLVYSVHPDFLSIAVRRPLSSRSGPP